MNELVDFKLNVFLEAAQELARADEVERALKLLDNLPAWYRDHEPKEITRLRTEILSKIATINFYKEIDCHPDLLNVDQVCKLLRCKLLTLEVKKLNELNYTPHIVDFGPGEYWVPLVLNKFNLKYTYQPLSINDISYEKNKFLFENHLSKKTDQPTIFLALEIIEHLWAEQEIKINMLRECGYCDIIHVSTPKYTHRYDQTDWRAIGTLGHLRAYTPTEFFTIVQDMFKEYGDFMFYDSVILHARGQWSGSKLPKYQLELPEDKA